LLLHLSQMRGVTPAWEFQAIRQQKVFPQLAALQLVFGGQISGLIRGRPPWSSQEATAGHLCGFQQALFCA
jgi:hypothetical protein